MVRYFDGLSLLTPLLFVVHKSSLLGYDMILYDMIWYDIDQKRIQSAEEENKEKQQGKENGTEKPTSYFGKRTVLRIFLKEARVVILLFIAETWSRGREALSPVRVRVLMETGIAWRVEGNGQVYYVKKEYMKCSGDMWRDLKVWTRVHNWIRLSTGNQWSFFRRGAAWVRLGF